MYYENACAQVYRMSKLCKKQQWHGTILPQHRLPHTHFCRRIPPSLWDPNSHPIQLHSFNKLIRSQQHKQEIARDTRIEHLYKYMEDNQWRSVCADHAEWNHITIEKNNAGFRFKQFTHTKLWLIHLRHGRFNAIVKYDIIFNKSWFIISQKDTTRLKNGREC